MGESTPATMSRVTSGEAVGLLKGRSSVMVPQTKCTRLGKPQHACLPSMLLPGVVSMMRSLGIRPWWSLPPPPSPLYTPNQVLLGSHRWKRELLSWDGGTSEGRCRLSWSWSSKALTLLGESSEYLHGSHGGTGGCTRGWNPFLGFGRWNYLQPLEPLSPCSPEQCWQVEWMLFLWR